MEMINRLTRRSAIRLFGALSAVALFAAAGGSVRPTLEAQSTSNPIVVENSLAGSPQSEWDVQGAGDPTLQGFATDISVNLGSVVSFKVKTSAPGFVIDIYRLGYYQGLGARKVATVTPSAAEIATAQSQPECQTDGASGLVDCGNWSVAGSWDTTGVTSGIFIAKLSRSDNLDASSHIYFIVRDDSRTSEILFQTSDTTWQAYNQYGGNSLYCGGPFSNSAGRYSCQTRASKVSYNRPFDTRAHDPQSFVFNAEYPMVRWLEANGYDVKYWTGVDTDRFGVDPAIGLTSPHRPKAFFSVGHDEYWSAAPRPRRERTQQRRQPRVLQRQRDVLEDALRAVDRRLERELSHAGQLQGNLRTRQPRRSRFVQPVDRHLARPAVPGRRRREAGERAHRAALDGQLLQRPDSRTRLHGRPAFLAQHSGRESRAR